MRPERETGTQVALALADACALGLLWWLTPDLRASFVAHWPFDLIPGPESVFRPVDPHVTRSAGLVFLPVWLAVLSLRGHWLDPLARRLPAGRIVVSASVALAVSLALLYLARFTDLSRTVTVGFALASVPVLLGTRWLVRRLARWLPATRWHVVVVGPAPAVGLWVDRVHARPELRVQVVGRVTEGRAADQLLDVVHRTSVDEIRYLGRLDGTGQLEDVVRLAAELGMTVTVDPEAWGTAVPTDRSLALRFAPSRGPGLLAKRVFDLLVGGLLLTLSLPLVALSALAIRLQDGGPVLYAEPRAGLHGRPFRMLKLRTMVADAESRRGDLAPFNETGGLPFKMRDDPRVTPVGRVLRRWSIDELPQLLHVVRGQMSLVGPRPARLDEVSRYDCRQRRRLAVRPGITCIWQVSGRSDVPWERWVEMDLEYIDRWSLLLDLRLLAQTIPAVLWGDGAR